MNGRNQNIPFNEKDKTFKTNKNKENKNSSKIKNNREKDLYMKLSTI